VNLLLYSQESVKSIHVSCGKERQTKFMKANYSKLFTKLGGILGVTGISILVTLPSAAKAALNPEPIISQAVTHHLYPEIQGNFLSTPAVLAQATPRGSNKRKKPVTSNGGSAVNPRPSIFNEPTYNRSGVNTPVTIPSKPMPLNAPNKVPSGGAMGKTNNLVSLVESNQSLKTLVKALKAAGLTEVLQGPGPFTIFAPTDAAFAKLPQDALQDLLKPENKEVLVKVLTYHVVRGSVSSRDLKSGQVTSLQGDPITVKVDPVNGVMVNDAKVTQPDIQGSNGVIHQIDNLILPPSL
jgi:uncharacterized surface protein with fasciclin (FAS1) repeats